VTSDYKEFGVTVAANAGRPDDPIMHKANALRELIMNSRPTDEEVDESDPIDDALLFKGGKGGGGGGGGGKGRNFDPWSQDQSGSLFEDGTVVISLLDGASDKNDDPLGVTEINGAPITYNTWILLASGAQIYLGSSGQLTYDPNGTFDHLDDGESAFENLNYTLSDGRGGSTTSSISVEIFGSTDEPQSNTDAVDDQFEAESTSVSVLGVLENDVDSVGDGLTILSINGENVEPGGHVHLASGAEVSVNGDGTLSYDPTGSGLLGEGVDEDFFSYTVRDANGITDTALAEITIVQVDPNPIPPATDEFPDYIQALIAGDEDRFNADQPLGSPDIITFAFPTAAPSYYSSSSTVATTFQTFTAEQQQTVRDIFANIEEMTNLTFVETTADEAEMIFGVVDLAGDARGMAYYPSAYSYGYDGDVWIDAQTAGTAFEPGTIGHLTLLHEIGHAMGLTHPDTTNLSWIESTRQYTDMAYGEHVGTDAEPSTYMLYDIAALQHLYGSNQTATASDDHYVQDDEVRTIWDAGGSDTLDFSGSDTSAIVNLNAGSFSSSGGQEDNLAIAFGTEIENAVGTDFDDLITGNEGENALTGGAGADVFFTGLNSGNDRITDFDANEDQISFAGLDFADLFFEVTDDGLLISYDGGSLNLERVENPDELDILFG